MAQRLGRLAAHVGGAALPHDEAVEQAAQLAAHPAWLELDTDALRRFHSHSSPPAWARPASAAAELLALTATPGAQQRGDGAGAQDPRWRTPRRTGPAAGSRLHGGESAAAARRHGEPASAHCQREEVRAPRRRCGQRLPHGHQRRGGAGRADGRGGRRLLSGDERSLGQWRCWRRACRCWWRRGFWRGCPMAPFWASRCCLPPNSRRPDARAPGWRRC